MSAHAHTLAVTNDFDIDLAVTTGAFQNRFYGFANLGQLSCGRQFNCYLSSFLLDRLIEFAHFVEDHRRLSLVRVFDATGDKHDRFRPDEIAVFTEWFRPGHALHGS